MASNDFENLLGEFQRLPPRPKRLPTLMEVAGYPHYENVCSNILGFFFHPRKPHGLGTLFLDALARIGDIQDQEEVGSNVSVSREATTKTGKRIDLLIESDSHAILIENKIDSGVDNPFAEYAAHLDSLEPVGRSKHKFLLTLRPYPKDVGHDFKKITHDELVKKIRALLGDYVAGADTRYLTFLLDFLNTLDDLQGGMVMDPEFLDFLKSHGDDVERLLIRIRAFKQELRNKVEQLAASIDVGSYRNVERKFWGGQFWGKEDNGSLFDMLVHDISLASGLVVGVDTVITTSGWSSAQIFVRRGGNKADLELRNLLQRLKIPIQKIKGKRLIHPTHCEYGADFGRIAEVVEDVVRKLATSDGAS